MFFVWFNFHMYIDYMSCLFCFYVFIILSKLIHRSLGVHISFVRSIAMDSWTEKQLQAMKLGGNQACNDYLQQKTNNKVSARTPIRQKYDNPTAQLYKEILKARVEGRPEPTSLPLAVPKSSAPAPNHRSMNGMSHATGGSSANQDPNGMERLLGETEEQYVARQTRLREEARVRMAAKFGSGGFSASTAGRMQGIGSDARYNPNTGGYGNAASSEFDVNSLVAGFGSVLGSAVSTAKSLADESTLQSIKSTGVSFWGGLTSTVSNVAASITTPQDESDGLADLQRQIAAQKSSQPGGSKYSGFGSDSSMFMNSSAAMGNSEPARSAMASATPPPYASSQSGGTVQEAPGLPGEDRNGVERLTGESDEQYVVRQTRLRDEARARMAAKFGGGGLSGAGSSAAPRSSLTPPPSSYNPGNQLSQVAAPSMAPPAARSAPSSGNFPRNKTPPKIMNSNDFFSSFGS
jgi:ADP-ribosylation factor GTPase-activating protein 1